MIAKRIDKDPAVADNFNQLGSYLAAADQPGEKLHELWISNCDAGATLDDLPQALAEIEATRKLNPRKSVNKTYHLVVSFRPGEGENLTRDQLKDIEQSYAEALGFADHQRIAATHQNTDHFHMHIAINKVHPKTLKIYTPFKDFVALEKTSRDLEQKYGLSVDRGMSDRSDGPPRPNQAARDFEAQTWQQSFQGFLIENREELLKAIAEAGGWEELHAALAEYGVELVKKGNGLVFKHKDGKQAMKASQLDRSCSKNALEKRLGAFEPQRNKPTGQDPSPAHGPDLGDNGLSATSEQSPSKPRPKMDAGQDPSPSQAPNSREGQRSPSVGQPSGNQAFAAGKEVKLSPASPRYEARPLTNHPATSALWRRFLDYKPPRQPKASSLLGRFASNWKTWLYMEAYKDPSAIVIIMFYKELFRMFDSSQRPDLLPAPVRKPIKDVGTWIERKSSPWAGWIPKLSGLTKDIMRDDEGSRAITFRDIAGAVWGVRIVTLDGRRTKDIGDLKLSGLMQVIDPDRQITKKPVILTSDEGLAAAIYKETQTPVVLVPNPAAAAEVAKALRGKHPEIHLMAMFPHGTELPKLDPSIQVTTAPKNASAKALRRTLADLVKRKKGQDKEQEQDQGQGLS